MRESSKTLVTLGNHQDLRGARPRGVRSDNQNTIVRCGASNHLRQVRAPRTALVVQTPRLLPRAVGVGPVKQLSVYPVALDKTVDVVTPASAALVALDVGHVELADQFPEYDRAVEPNVG